MKIKLPAKKVRKPGYTVHLDTGILEKLPKLLKKRFKHSSYAIITDTNVRRLYGNKLVKQLQESGLSVELYSFTPGEVQKSLATVERILERMIKNGHDRKSCVLCLGGGIVGDTGGFIAASFMRGIDLIQIPTTLLSMCDSSIGGKTGVNAKAGKNLIGAFYPPDAIFSDLHTLHTLKDEDFSNGLAEVIKHAAIQDKTLFKYLEKNLEKVLAREKKALKYVISRAIKVKMSIVDKDEKESGLRMILNYGHTYGHAIEKATKYQIPHGYAVAIGMVLINDIAVKAGVMKKNDATRIKELLNRANLPTKLPKNLNKMKLRPFLSKDKKRTFDKLNWIIVPEIGKAAIASI